MRNRIALSGALFAGSFLALSGAALAAPTYNWSGFYIGGNAGYGWGTADVGDVSLWNDSAGTSLYGTIPAFSFDLRGALGGAEAGVNWQGGAFVGGLVADIDAAHIAGSHTDLANNFSVDATIRWLSTLRANVGVAFGNVLLFGSAGVGFGGVEATLHDTYGGTVLDTSDSNVHTGWVAGLGAAFGITSNSFIKVEWLHADLGSRDYAFPEDPSGVVGFPLITTSASVTANIVRASFDWKW